MIPKKTPLILYFLILCQTYGIACRCNYSKTDEFIIEEFDKADKILLIEVINIIDTVKQVDSFGIFINVNFPKQYSIKIKETLKGKEETLSIIISNERPCGLVRLFKGYSYLFYLKEKQLNLSQKTIKLSACTKYKTILNGDLEELNNLIRVSNDVRYSNNEIIHCYIPRNLFSEKRNNNELAQLLKLKLEYQKNELEIIKTLTNKDYSGIVEFYNNQFYLILESKYPRNFIQVAKRSHKLISIRGQIKDGKRVGKWEFYSLPPIYNEVNYNHNLMSEKNYSN